jgi:hypothetical protein
VRILLSNPSENGPLEFFPDYLRGTQEFTQAQHFFSRSLNKQVSGIQDSDQRASRFFLPGTNENFFDVQSMSGQERLVRR